MRSALRRRSPVRLACPRRSPTKHRGVGQVRHPLNRIQIRAPIRIACYALLGVLAAVPLSAQTNREGPVALTTEINRRSAHVVEPIELTLIFEAPRGTKIKFPEVGTSLGAFEIVDWGTQMELPIEGDNPARRSLAVIKLESINAGEFTVPPLEVQYRLPDTNAEWRSLRTEPLELQIVSLLEDRPDPTDFRDIKSPVEIEISEQASRQWIVWASGGVLAAIGTALLAVFALRRRQRISPAQWALRQLESLEQDKTREAVGPELVYGELTSVIRQFLQLQYGVAASAQSSGEMVKALADFISESDLEPLTKFLALADDVRFARLSLDDERLTKAMNWSRQFIRECQGAADA